ncbi:MAG: M50 family metallopeptidase [Pseudomonadota bacterium]
MVDKQGIKVPDRDKIILAFWAAVAVNLALAFVPHGDMVLYPFALLSTWAHEMGHGVTAIFVGGEFRKMELYRNLGGVAFSTRPDNVVAPVMISAGGLLGPAIAGGFIIVLGSNAKVGRWVLEVLGVLLIVSALIWIRNPFGLGSIVTLGAVLFLIGYFASDLIELCIVQFIGIRLCLESLSDVDYMFTKQFERDGQIMLSDTQKIAEHLLLPYWVWGAIIAVLSVVILAVAFYLAWMRTPARRATSI